MKNDLKVDPSRSDRADSTGIYVRAKSSDGWGSHDIATLTRDRATDAARVRAAVFLALASDGAPTLTVDESYRLADAVADRAVGPSEWIPPSAHVTEPGPCTPMAHHWASGSSMCQCGEATREGDCRGWRVESRLTDAQIQEAVTGRQQVAVDQATYRAFKDIDNAATLADLETLMMSLAGKLGAADRDDAEQRYYERKAWLETQESAEPTP